MEEYHNIRELQLINATHAGFGGANMVIRTQDKISEALNNLTIYTASEKYVITQITSIIKQLEETNKILTDQLKTLIATNVCLA